MLRLAGIQCSSPPAHDAADNKRVKVKREVVGSSQFNPQGSTIAPARSNDVSGRRSINTGANVEQCTNPLKSGPVFA